MALTCKLSRDILRTTSCGYSLPEVKDIYLLNYTDLEESGVGDGVAYGEDTATTTCSGAVITAMTIPSGASFYHIEPAKNSVTFEDTLVVEDNGNKYRTHSLTFNISGKYNQCLHDDLDALALGRYFAVVVTADGMWLGLGRLGGLEAETATLSGGGDTNGLQIVLSGNVTESAVPLNEEMVNKVKGVNKNG